MQTKIGAKKAAQTMKEKYGEDFFKNIGSQGGKTKTLTPKGFAAMDKDRLQKVSSKGGSKSKRGKKKEDETNLTDKQKYYRKWYKNNGRKRHELQQKAHSIVSKAILKGDLIRPEKCTRCERTFKIEGHHEDYDKPLEVIWLCNRCHRKIHTGS